MSSMGLYIVLVFFAAQFVAFFGTPTRAITAVLGAHVLVRDVNLDNPAVFVFVHPDVLLRQPDARQRQRAVGGHGADLRADAHD
jgi:uracil-DNA glycosylase